MNFIRLEDFLPPLLSLHLPFWLVSVSRVHFLHSVVDTVECVEMTMDDGQTDAYGLTASRLTPWRVGMELIPLLVLGLE